MTTYVGAIDQGTTSTRFMIFDHGGNEVARHQLEHEQIMPQAGLGRARPGRDLGAHQLGAPDGARAGRPAGRRTSPPSASPTSARPPSSGTAAPGAPTTTRSSGRTPAPTASPRRSTATAAVDVIRRKAGLPPATYFSGGKIQWILENVDGVREAAEAGDAIFGTTDSWLLWNLTGGADGGVHVTDVDQRQPHDADGPRDARLGRRAARAVRHPAADAPGDPARRSDPELYGHTLADGPFGGAVPLAGDLGDQQAAMVGQVCFAPGEAKNTYGTGNFMLLNTGTELVRSENGPAHDGRLPVRRRSRRSTPSRARSPSPARRCSGCATSSASSAAPPRARRSPARSPDNGGVYFVPAFSGLFAPYWRSDARGAIVGLSRFNTNAHLARATLEAICYQSRDVADAMEKDSGVDLDVLKVDGGVTANELCMQIQADVLGVPVSRPVVAETTALGAAYAAGLAVGFWTDTDELRANWNEDKRWEPQWSDEQRDEGYAGWQKAVERTLDWVDVD